MSTATTLKRVALAAVYALGFGLLSVAPSNAIVNNDSLALSTATSTYTLGSAAASTTATITFVGSSVGDNVTTTAVLTSAPAGSAVFPTWGGSFASNSANAMYATGSGGQAVGVHVSGSTGLATATAVLSLTPDVAGTYVVSVSQSAGGVVTRSTSWTVTAAAKPAVTAAASSSIRNAGAFDTATADATVLAASTAASGAGSQAATIVVQARNGVETLTASTALTVTISGPGSLAIGFATATAGALTPTGARVVAGAAGQNYIGVFADGTAGKATITIAAGTTTLATEEVTFFGTTASLVVDTTTIAANIGVGENDTITFNALDANGNRTSFLAAHGVSSDTTVATVTVAGGVATVVGVKPGTATIQVCNADCTSTAATVKSQAVTVTVLPVATGNAFKVTLSLDKATYLPGEKMVLTVSAVDTSTPALAIADGSRALISGALAATGGVIGLPGAGNIALVGGKKTYDLYAPLGGGSISISGTDATTAGGTISVSAVVSNPAQDAADAATDAALEAIDAANAATDAANLAAEAADAATVAAEEARDAADAATAAVEALAAEVTTMIAEIKAQLTALANVVAKIAKKVKA